MRTLAIALATVVSVASIANAANCCDCKVPTKPTKVATSVKTTVTTTAKVSGSLPSIPCAANGKYYRGTSAMLAEFKLMASCDASTGHDNGGSNGGSGHPVGAVNLKAIDGNLSSVSRPTSGPAYTPAGCVVTFPGYGSKFAWNRAGNGPGCRDEIKGSASKVNGQLVMTLSSGNYVVTNGWSGVSLKAAN